MADVQPGQKIAEKPLDDAVLDALREAELQIEYLHGRFRGTGSGEAALVKIRRAIQRLEHARRQDRRA